MTAIRSLNGKLVENDNEFDIIATNETVSVLCRSINDTDDNGEEV